MVFALGLNLHTQHRLEEQGGQRSGSWTWEVSRELDLSCKGSLAEGEAHYFTRVMYQSRDRVVNGNYVDKRREPYKTREDAPCWVTA